MLRQNLRVYLCLLFVSACAAWVSFPSNIPTKRSVMSMRRGRGSLGKEVGGGNGMGSSTSSVNWIPIQVSAKSLPSEDNKVAVIDTNLPTMKNAQTNPTGAVSVVKYNGQTYCFAVNCPSCKIPMTKAQCIKGESGPSIVCDFCKATYDLKSGAKQKSTAPKGILGGIANSIFSSQSSGPLPIYKLGEKNGKLLIALD